VAILESSQRRAGAGHQQRSARDARAWSGLDDAISLTEVHMNPDPREAIALLRYRIVAVIPNSE